MRYNSTLEVVKLEIELYEGLKRLMKGDAFWQEIIIAIAKIGDIDVTRLPKPLQKTYPMIHRMLCERISIDEFDRLHTKVEKMVTIYTDSLKYE